MRYLPELGLVLGAGVEMLQQCETRRLSQGCPRLQHYHIMHQLAPSARLSARNEQPRVMARNEQPRAMARHDVTELDTGLNLLLGQVTALRQLPFRMEVD